MLDLEGGRCTFFKRVAWDGYKPSRPRRLSSISSLNHETNPSGRCFPSDDLCSSPALIPPSLLLSRWSNAGNLSSPCLLLPGDHVGFHRRRHSFSPVSVLLFRFLVSRTLKGWSLMCRLDRLTLLTVNSCDYLSTGAVKDNSGDHQEQPPSSSLLSGKSSAPSFGFC